MLRMDVAERRRRLGSRHGLHPSAQASDPLEAARRVVALHATDPASVFLAVRARSPRATPASVEDALYDRRDLVRMLGMRRTVFVVPTDLMRVIGASTMRRVADTQRRHLLKQLREAGVADNTEGWLAEVECAVLAALTKRGGTAIATELAADEPRLRTSLLMAEGKPYEARQNITSRVLLLLGAEGHIVRGRPTGSWLSQRYQWTLAELWSSDAQEPTSPRAARAELARQWLAAFGPAPVADLRWWTGWSATEVKQAVGDLHVTEVDLGDTVGIVLTDDLERTPATAEPWVAFLPALDPTVMGWSDRGWFLGDHEKALFDRNGNAGPTVWLGGRIVGGWAQRPDGEVAVKLLEDIGSDHLSLVTAEAARLTEWLGDARIIPRFRTPTERELSA
ncbi:winged helix DNA-binding domain-containing protein [Actinopolymorpha alba]|uniref:winged helix DNA-binding domain-containing protein n=1 Tax=Actinopolymorpha alba TaxID=533267 RepID=UPI0004758AE7|nr:winged helix DNA-binding domain-containing protein [Actinopolymorpha alba]